MVDKGINTGPLTVISPDEIIDLGNILSLLKFDSSLEIFVDTLNSDYIFCKSKLSRGPSRVTRIGLLAIQPMAHKGSQTKELLQQRLENHKCYWTCHVPLESAAPSATTPNTTALAATKPVFQMDFSSSNTTTSKSMAQNTLEKSHTKPTLQEICQTKPTQPSLFVPPVKRHKLASILKK